MAIVQKTFTVGGKTLSKQRALSAKAELSREELLSPARAGTLSTRTDDDTGVITLAAGVGVQFTVGEYVDVYWDVSGVKGHRRRMKVSSISTDNITVGTASPGDTGSGDNFPIATSPVALAHSVVGNLDFDGDDLVLLAFEAGARGIFVLAEADLAEDHFVHFNNPDADGWDNQTGEVNPVAGKTIAKVYMSHADTSVPRTMKVGVAFN